MLLADLKDQFTTFKNMHSMPSLRRGDAEFACLRSPDLEGQVETGLAAKRIRFTGSRWVTAEAGV